MSANDPRGWGHLSYASCSPSPSRKGRRTIWLYCVKGAWISTPHVPVNGRTVTPPKTASGGLDEHRLRPLKFTKNNFTNMVPLKLNSFHRNKVISLINLLIHANLYTPASDRFYSNLFMPCSYCQLLISSYLPYIAMHQC